MAVGRDLRLLAAFLFLALLSQLPLHSASPGEKAKILVVCSDPEDVMFANTLGAEGNFTVDVLYLGRDLPDDRSLLSNELYLIKYDEIWIPDLNSEWTYGGRLTRDEIAALGEYVKRGGILVLGLNTYTQSWSRTFERITGSRLMRVEKPKKTSEEWDLVFKGKVYPYNATYQVAIVSPYRAQVLAQYSNGLPAITLSRYGRGVGVLMTFNPVKELVEYNPTIIDVYVYLATTVLSERSGKPEIPLYEALIIKLERTFLHPIFLGVLILVVLEILAYLGFVPFSVTVISAIPFLPFSEFLLRKEPYSTTLETVRILRGVTLTNLAGEIGKTPRRLKFPLAVLFLKRQISLIDLSSLGFNDTLVVLRGLEAEGVAAWAIEVYPKMMEKIANNPGIGVIDLARQVNMPPYDVLRLLRELSRYGVVELRKIVVDYEVYPMRALLRWFEA